MNEIYLPAVQISKNNIYKIKILCIYEPTEIIHKKWSKFIGKYPIEFVTENPDFWIIINKPPEGEYYEPKRTIVIGMAPDTFFSNRWQWFSNKKDFLYFLDENYHNSCEWWLSLSHDELLEKKIEKKHDCVISAIVSSEYKLPGHIARINFLKNAEKLRFEHPNEYKEINFHIYGWTNPYYFYSYISPLPVDGKDEGLFPYKYTIAIENCQRKNYFTEKLIDGILSECLVFYWGCPNIHDFFDPMCVILIDPENSLGTMNIIKSCIKNNEWEKRKKYILEAKNQILNYYSFAPRICGLLNILSLEKYTINLDHRKDRWETHIKLCSEQQLYNIKRFSAINGSKHDLHEKYIQSKFLFTNYMLCKNVKGFIGCALSHYNLWEKCIKEDKPMLIMEDDVIFNDFFIDKLGNIMNYHEYTKKIWDMFFIGYFENEDNHKIYGLSETFLVDSYRPFDIINMKELFKFGTYKDPAGLTGGGTFGYLISPSGAKKMIEFVNDYHFYLPVDYQIIDFALIFNGILIELSPHKLLYSKKFGVDTFDSDIQK